MHLAVIMQGVVWSPPEADRSPTNTTKEEWDNSFTVMCLQTQEWVAVGDAECFILGYSKSEKSKLKLALKMLDKACICTTKHKYE